MRDESISMTKGFAIILMVLVHARFSHYGDTYINMFHMPLFFFMSGYCFKESYLNNFRAYFWKRVKGAYWPFVKWGLLFLFLHNVFFYLNVYNGEYGFRGRVSHLYTIKDFLEHAITIVVSMSGSEQLLGGYWFLHSYFVAAIIAFPTIWLFNRKWKSPVGGGILLIITIIFCKFNISLSRFLNATDLLAAFFMVMGYFYKQSKWCLEDYSWLTIPVGAIIVAIGTAYWPCAMQKLTWIKATPYSFSALAGTLMVFSVAKVLIKKECVILTKIVSFIGDRTLEILTWHFLCFKLCSLIIIAMYSLPMTRLAEFPVIEEYAYQGWWLPYLITGVLMPLLVTFVINKANVQINKLYLNYKN